MPNLQPLTILTDLRKAAGLSLSDMARVCGLSGNQSHQTAGAWELGRMTPTVRRRVPFIRYLWDTLALRKQPAQFMQVWEVLVEEWDWEPLRDAEWQRLTSAPRPLAALPTVTATRTAPFQAPALTPHFVGRYQELADLRQRLLDPQPPAIYALVGMGGVGKTTLVTHLAHTLRQHFADGVLWARVATTHPLDIAQSWAQAYGYDYSTLSDVESRGAALRGMLAEKQALLILDDVTNPQWVRALLPGSGSAVVLLTTRDHDVAATLHAQRLTVAELAPQASLELLGLLLDPQRLAAEPAAAQEICGALHHLPLAVEIAAQRLNVRERQKLSTLATQLRDISARLDLALGDRAVRASFLSSWSLLDTALQRVFACCGVFAGRSFPLAALAHVAGLSITATEEMLFSLAALSLLKPEEADCYRQHPLLADFACEQLGDDPIVDGRLADYYLAFARQHQTDYALLEPAWANIMAAMSRAYARQQWAMVLAYAETLTAPWFTLARYTQARQGYTWAVVAAEMTDKGCGAAFYWQKGGQAALEQDDYAEAAVQLAKADALYQQLQDEPGLAMVHYWLARLAIEQGRYVGADEHLHTCQHLHAAQNDQAGLALVFYQQASLAYNRGELMHAQTLCEQAMQIQQSLEDGRELSPTLRMLADIAIEHRDFSAAQHLCNQALAVAQRFHNRPEIAASLYGLAVIAGRQEQFELAFMHGNRAYALFEQMGDQGFQALILHEQSILYRKNKQFAQAKQCGLDSLQRLRRLQDNFALVYVLNDMGKLYHEFGDPEAAQRFWQEALTRAEPQNHPLWAELCKRCQ